jgi:hypothetical protein
LVLTLPFELRARLAYDGKLLGAVCHERGWNGNGGV